MIDGSRRGTGGRGDRCYQGIVCSNEARGVGDGNIGTIDVCEGYDKAHGVVPTTRT